MTTATQKHDKLTLYYIISKMTENNVIAALLLLLIVLDLENSNITTNKQHQLS